MTPPASASSKHPHAPLFVGGLMKSGTTLLRALISNHPHIFGGLETHWFVDDFGVPDAASTKRLQEWFDLDDDTLGALLHDVDLLDAECPRNVRMLDVLMRHLCQRSGKSRWVEKTPGNIFHLDAIFEHHPDAKFFHVIRDPRDVYASWKRNQKHNVDRFIEDLQRAEASVGARLGHDDERYMEVHYNDLVRDPKGVMTRVIDFIGEEWVDGIEVNAKDRSEYDRVLAATGKRSTTLESLAQPIFTKSIGQYVDILDDDEQARIVAAAAHYAEQTGCFATSSSEQAS